MGYILEISQTSCIMFFVITFILKKHSKIFLFVYPLIVLMCCIGVYISSSFLMASCVELLLYLILPYFMSKCSAKSTLYIYLVVLGLVSTLLCLINMALYCLGVYKHEVIITAIISSVILICFLAIYFLNKKIQLLIMRLRKITLKIKITFLIIIWSLFALLSINYIGMSNYFNKEINITMSILFGTLLAGSTIMFVYLLKNYFKSEHYENLSHTLEENIKNQTQYYENVILRYNNLRVFKHDYNNLKIGLNNLLETGQTEAAIKYLNDAEDKFKTPYQFIDTGNTVVDAIISDKQNKILDYNIIIRFSGIIPNDAIEISDLCVALGNGLDNAVEACMKITDCREKIIEIEAVQKHSFVLIKISNPIAKKVDIYNNVAASSKENATAHGLGLYSINNIVKKYNGFYEINSTEKDFILKMGFMIKSNDGIN